MSKSKTCDCGEPGTKHPLQGRPTAAGSGDKLVTYQSILDYWWPVGSPFPPAMPWLGVRVSREAVENAMTKYQARLPLLPDTSGSAATHPANLEVLMEFAAAIAAKESGANLIYSGDESCCGTSKGCKNCEQAIAVAFGDPCGIHMHGLGDDIRKCYGVVQSDEGGVCNIDCFSQVTGEWVTSEQLVADESGCYFNFVAATPLWNPGDGAPFPLPWD